MGSELDARQRKTKKLDCFEGEGICSYLARLGNHKTEGLIFKWEFSFYANEEFNSRNIRKHGLWLRNISIME